MVKGDGKYRKSYQRSIFPPASERYTYANKMFIPFEVIAKWPTPNNVSPETHNPAMVVIIIFLMICVTVLMGIRLYTRQVISNGAGLDDVLILLAFVRPRSGGYGNDVLSNSEADSSNSICYYWCHWSAQPWLGPPRLGCKTGTYHHLPSAEVCILDGNQEIIAEIDKFIV